MCVQLARAAKKKRGKKEKGKEKKLLQSDTVPSQESLLLSVVRPPLPSPPPTR
jgi:hypothetical protein